MQVTDRPIRYQRSRRKGSRLPGGVVCCTRPGKFGNPFKTVSEFRCVLKRMVDGGALPATDTDSEKHMKRLADSLPEIRGKSLACWCSLDSDCHVDVILEFANDRKGGDL